MVSEAVIEVRDAIQETTHCGSFLTLMEQYGPALRRLAGAYVIQPPDREDLFQEIAVAIWQAIPKFRGESSERTWLYRIAHNVAISSSAKLRRKKQREESIPESFDRPSVSSDAEQDLLKEEKRRLLIGSIRDLPAVDRQIVLLHLEGLSYVEIEEVTGLSETAIATRLTRIREKLKARIQSREGGSQ
jgi:RNA polymerase sigma-70 factor, ECF subfamily